MTHASHNREECLRMFARLSEYLDGELDEISCGEIEGHVGDCIPCEACFSTLKRTVELCRETGSVAVPESLSQRLKEIMHAFLKLAH